MSELIWIAEHEQPTALPAVSEALSNPNGLLAAGGSLSPEWLIYAYRHGIFPWYELGQPVLWWSPDPRAVLWTDSLRVSRSLRRTIGRHEFAVTADTAFHAVIDACAGPRQYTDSTWITPHMSAAFKRLHELGWAHSFEAWQDEELVGGLYGVSIGHVFFGESMFSRKSNASKVAFVAAVRYFERLEIPLIDCQIQSEHLTSLGATDMPRSRFLAELDKLCAAPHAVGSWREDFCRAARIE